jgi:uncharacterized protein (DUF488 family)
MKDAAAASAGPLHLFTIGFAGKSAQEFFELLQIAGVRRVLDVRLNNVSQLAAFTKQRDLEYFLRAIAGIAYEHLEQLAPTKEILDRYKHEQITWAEYERDFNLLLATRRPESSLTPEYLDRACLLCSEPTADQCHRRLVAEYLQHRLPGIVVEHL